MRRSAAFYADRPAVQQDDRILTFAEAWDRGVRLANGLLGLGLEPGDRVASLEDNTLEAQDFFAGAAAAGLVRVPLYARDSRAAYLHNLRHTGCRALVVDVKYLSAVEGLREELPDLRHILVRDEKYESWLADQSDIDPDPRIDPDDWYIIRHTGGTTGYAKGVANTQRSWLAAGRDWTYALPPIQVGDRCLHAGPISHGSGYLYLPMWLQGACNVFLDAVDAGKIVELLETLPVQYMFAVPTLVNAMAMHPSARGRDYRHLKAILVAGAPISEATASLAADVFGPSLHQLYGQTEALPATFMGPRDWFTPVEGSNPLRSAGRPLPFADLEIRDHENRPLPAGEEGEIAIRCEGQMLGYWEDPELTKDRLVDGWVLTGDIGRLDDNGFLYVSDRKNDVIISGGYNIWPAELENAISSHPDIIEVAVFGIPHEKWGESPMAVCVLPEGAAVTESEVIQLCSDQLGSYKKPSRVVLQTEPLPKSPVGKVQRKVLRDPHWRGHARKVAGA
jgi:acyl-CoA synthetase (AMP-forming)/AMP-acid ligase II